MFFDNLLQVRIEFFTVRAVVVGKHHQGELWVFRADARGVWIVKQEISDHLLRALLLVRRQRLRGEYLKRGQQEQKRNKEFFHDTVSLLRCSGW